MAAALIATRPPTVLLPDTAAALRVKEGDVH